MVICFLSNKKQQHSLENIPCDLEKKNKSYEYIANTRYSEFFLYHIVYSYATPSEE
jgi:hypothetical protein